MQFTPPQVLQGAAGSALLAAAGTAFTQASDFARVTVGLPRGGPADVKRGQMESCNHCRAADISRPRQLNDSPAMLREALLLATRLANLPEALQ